MSDLLFMRQQDGYPWKSVAKELNLDSVDDERSDQQHHEMGWLDDKLSVFPPDSGPVFVDFTHGKSAHRQRFGGGKGQPLIRAIGQREDTKLHVVDATAGLAADSFVMACCGYKVSLIEASPVLSALIRDGLERGAASDEFAEIITRMTLFTGDSLQVLDQITEIDVIYLDPMYPHTKKSAAVKKGMQLIQQLVGEDQTGEALLVKALDRAKYRVVVKRPKSAPPLGGQRPNTCITSPNTRYDIYTLRSLKQAK